MKRKVSFSHRHQNTLPGTNEDTGTNPKLNPGLIDSKFLLDKPFHLGGKRRKLRNYTSRLQEVLKLTRINRPFFPKTLQERGQGTLSQAGPHGINTVQSAELQAVQCTPGFQLCRATTHAGWAMVISYFVIMSALRSHPNKAHWITTLAFDSTHTLARHCCVRKD